MTRVADVCLKERRKLILLARETPLSAIHLENMLTVARAGGVIMPPVPAFYTNPARVEEIVDGTVLRVMDLLSLDAGSLKRWEGP
jgi:4-hydroxy-3-polyprenylbenzoate decarboxylase